VFGKLSESWDHFAANVSSCFVVFVGPAEVARLVCPHSPSSLRCQPVVVVWLLTWPPRYPRTLLTSFRGLPNWTPLCWILFFSLELHCYFFSPSRVVLLRVVHQTHWEADFLSRTEQAFSNFPWSYHFKGVVPKAALGWDRRLGLGDQSVWLALRLPESRDLCCASKNRFPESALGSGSFPIPWTGARVFGGGLGNPESVRGPPGAPQSGESRNEYADPRAGGGVAGVGCVSGASPPDLSGIPGMDPETSPGSFGFVSRSLGPSRRTRTLVLLRPSCAGIQPAASFSAARGLIPRIRRRRKLKLTLSPCAFDEMLPLPVLQTFDI